MKIQATQLNDTLAKKLHSVYIISGDEPFQKEDASQKLRTYAREMGFTEQLIYHAEAQFDWSLVEENISTLSLFSSRKLIEIRIPSINKLSKDVEKSLSFCARHISNEILLVIICGKVSRATENASWFKKLESIGVWMPVWPIEGHNLINWLMNRMNAEKLKASKEAIHLLAERVEGNLLAASQEIEKMKLLATDGRVTIDHVKFLVANHAHYDIFGIAEAIIQGNARHAAQIFKGLCEENIELSKILWSIVRELRVLNQLEMLLSSGKKLDAAISVIATSQRLPLFALKRRRHDYLGCLNRLKAHGVFILLKKASEIDGLLKTGKENASIVHMSALIMQMTNSFPLSK